MEFSVMMVEELPSYKQNMDVFNTREIALGVWIALFIIFLISKRSTRESIAGLIKVAFAWKLTVIYLAVLIYTAVVVYFLFRAGLWDLAQRKNTVLWLVTVGFVCLFDITNNDKTNYFKDALIKIFKFTTILEFLIGFYTFNIFIELIIIPLAVLISLMIAVGKKEEKLNPAINFLNNTLVLFGLFLIIYTIYKVIHDFSGFATKGTLSDFLISPVLSFLFLPFVYILSLVVNLESAFVRINFKIKNKRLVRFARWQAVLHFHFNKNDLNRWQQIVFVRHPQTRADIIKTMKLVKQLKKGERNPPAVPFHLGWSPYQSKNFLVSKGITTKYYQPLYQKEWQAASSSIDLEDSILSSSVYYYVRGNRTTAERLLLKLNVFSPEGAKIAHAKFLIFAQSLYEAALNEPMPKIMSSSIIRGKDKSIESEERKISLTKTKWIGHKFNGYEMEFTITK